MATAMITGAGIIEGGAIVDIPGENMRRQFEVNVIGPVLLTQGIARNMIRRRTGKIVFMSSVVGILFGPFRRHLARQSTCLKRLRKL